MTGLTGRLGYGIRASEPIFEMCRCLGIQDLSAKLTRSRNRMNVIKAVLEGLRNQKLPGKMHLILTPACPHTASNTSNRHYRPRTWHQACRCTKGILQRRKHGWSLERPINTMLTQSSKRTKIRMPHLYIYIDFRYLHPVNILNSRSSIGGELKMGDFHINIV